MIASRMSLPACGALLLGALASQGFAQPTITNATRGSSHTTLADAISASMNGDLIEIGAGVLHEQGLILSNKVLTIRGVSAEETIIDGGLITGRIFSVRNGSDVVFERMTLRNGAANTNGGFGGGAIRVGGNAPAVIRECIFEGNMDNGEGIGAIALLTVGDVLVDRCIFRNNSADSFGSIAWTSGGNVSIVGCLFENEPGDEAVVGVLGAGAHVIVNCTFADVEAPRSIRVVSAGVNIMNSAFDNSTTEVFDVHLGGFANFSKSVYPGATGDNIAGVPTFVDSAGGDYRLARWSLGIDVGDSVVASTILGVTDLAGGPRLSDDPWTIDSGVPLFGASIDAGAFEYAPVTCAADFNEDGLVNTGDVLSFLSVYTAGCP